MTTGRIRCTTTLILLLSATTAGGAWARSDKLAQEGHAIAVARCSGCHATETTGASPLQTAPPFRSLAYGYPVEGIDEALAKGIVVGHPDMPSEPWDSTDIRRFVAYLKSIGPKP